MLRVLTHHSGGQSGHVGHSGQVAASSSWTDVPVALPVAITWTVSERLISPGSRNGANWLSSVVGKTGFVHAYVEGRPLSKERAIPDSFFDELFALLAELHRRDIAYVDTNKPQNILQGDDGRPHLIDFQISWDLAELGNSFLNRWWLRKLQRADIYHVLKHKRRLRPDEMSEEEYNLAEQRGVVIRIHRFLATPYKRIRRSTFKRMRESGRLLPEGSK